jgi:hypothetical protein
MSLADKKNIDRVLETSINKLTQDNSPALLHFGAQQVQQVLLVRLKQPGSGAPRSRGGAHERQWNDVRKYILHNNLCQYTEPMRLITKTLKS